MFVSIFFLAANTFIGHLNTLLTKFVLIAKSIFLNTPYNLYSHTAVGNVKDLRMIFAIYFGFSPIIWSNLSCEHIIRRIASHDVITTMFIQQYAEVFKGY